MEVADDSVRALDDDGYTGNSYNALLSTPLPATDSYMRFENAEEEDQFRLASTVDGDPSTASRTIVSPHADAKRTQDDMARPMRKLL